MLPLQPVLPLVAGGKRQAAASSIKSLATLVDWDVVAVNLGADTGMADTGLVWYRHRSGRETLTHRFEEVPCTLWADRSSWRCSN